VTDPAGVDWWSRRKIRASEAEETSTSDGSAGLLADSRTVAAWTLVSRITGFGRVAIIAAVLGPTYFGNVFQTTILLPYMIFALLGGSLVGGMLVPPLVRWIDGQDQIAVRRLANGFLGMAMSVLSIVVVVSAAVAPLLLTVVTAAVDDPHVRQQQQQVGWPLLLMLLPQILFYSVAATGMAVQHAHRRFALAAAAPALENVGIMSVLGASALVFGVGADLDEVTMPQLVLLGMGATAAVAMHAALQWWGAYRVGVSLVPRAGWREPEVRRMIRMAFTSSGYTGLYQVIFLGLLVVAGRIPGGVIAYQMGHNFSYLPVALGAAPLAAAQLPRLSRNFNEQNTTAFHATFRRSLALARFVALPTGLLLLTMSETLARAVAFGGMATVTGISMIAASIASLGPGVIGEAAMVVSTSASYARRDSVTPLRAMATRAAIALMGMVLALSAMDGIAVLWTLGLAVSAANLTSAAYLYRSVVLALPGAARYRSHPLIGELGASAISIVPGALIAAWLERATGTSYQKIGLAIAVIAVSGSFYLVIQWMRASRELISLLSGTRGPGLLGRSGERSRSGSSMEEEKVEGAEPS
jgi:putative peptidoglycan lipid II flippase